MKFLDVRLSHFVYCDCRRMHEIKYKVQSAKVQNQTYKVWTEFTKMQCEEVYRMQTTTRKCVSTRMASCRAYLGLQWYAEGEVLTN